MFIIMLGFIYTSYLILGPYVKNYKDILIVFSKLFFLMFGDSYKHDLIGGPDLVTSFANTFFIIFMLLFFFVLVKMLVSIVIIRYLYLRSAIHLDNMTRARLLEKENKEWLLKWINLFTFKRSDTENDSLNNRGNDKSS